MKMKSQLVFSGWAMVFGGLLSLITFGVHGTSTSFFVYILLGISGAIAFAHALFIRNVARKIRRDTPARHVESED